MTREESLPIIKYLIEKATDPKNVYRHRWSPDDVVIWDNACTMHYAFYDYDNHPRLLHRTTATGDRPNGPAMPLR